MYIVSIGSFNYLSIVNIYILYNIFIVDYYSDVQSRPYLEQNAHKTGESIG